VIGFYPFTKEEVYHHLHQTDLFVRFVPYFTFRILISFLMVIMFFVPQPSAIREDPKFKHFTIFPVNPNVTTLMSHQQ
jgi:hypothetical protein